MQKIMFSEKYGLESAVLSKLKTMTRRVITDVNVIQILQELEDDGWQNTADIQIFIEKYSRYKKGEVVAIAQAYKSIPTFDDPRFIYITPKHKGWTNKMFVRPELMPHQIRIADIRIERLQDISDEDCLKEGIFIPDTIKTIREIEGHRYGWYDVDDKESEHIYCFDVYGKHPSRWHFPTPKLAFETLINKISPKMEGKPMWDVNPFVFAYSFKLVK